MDLSNFTPSQPTQEASKQFLKELQILSINDDNDTDVFDSIDVEIPTRTCTPVFGMRVQELEDQTDWTSSYCEGDNGGDPSTALLQRSAFSSQFNEAYERLHSINQHFQLGILLDIDFIKPTMAAVKRLCSGMDIDKVYQIEWLLKNIIQSMVVSAFESRAYHLNEVYSLMDHISDASLKADLNQHIVSLYACYWELPLEVFCVASAAYFEIEDPIGHEALIKAWDDGLSLELQTKLCSSIMSHLGQEGNLELMRSMITAMAYYHYQDILEEDSLKSCGQVMTKAFAYLGKRGLAPIVGSVVREVYKNKGMNKSTKTYEDFKLLLHLIKDAFTANNPGKVFQEAFLDKKKTSNLIAEIFVIRRIFSPEGQKKAKSGPSLMQVPSQLSRQKDEAVEVVYKPVNRRPERTVAYIAGSSSQLANRQTRFFPIGSNTGGKNTQ